MNVGLLEGVVFKFPSSLPMMDALEILFECFPECGRKTSSPLGAVSASGKLVNDLGLQYKYSEGEWWLRSHWECFEGESLINLEDVI